MQNMVQQPKDAVMKDVPIAPRKVESVSGMVPSMFASMKDVPTMSSGEVFV